MSFEARVLYGLVPMFISFAIFSAIVNTSSNSFLKLFDPWYKIVRNVKHRKLLRGVVFIIDISIIVAIGYFFDLNSIVYGIVIGLFAVLPDVILGIGIVEKEN
ncbi:hypothetical protein SH2C18_31340 [Clostridium sediminicola]|uniref:hypothetical protein n=1 Tax=Clostridium sediminicola TaxID=3114879 RepID=UPI0031F22E9E